MASRGKKRVATIAALLAMPAVTHAQVSGSWLLPVAGSWIDGTRWSSSPSFPSSGGSAVFGRYDWNTSTITLNSPVTLSSISIDSSAFYRIDGNGTITLTGPAVINSEGPDSYEMPASLFGHAIIADLIGTAGLTKNGAGNVDLRNAAYTGETLVNEGVVFLPNAYGSSSQTITLNGGGLGVSTTPSGAASFNSPVVVTNAGGTLRLLASGGQPQVAGTIFNAPIRGVGTLTLRPTITSSTAAVIAANSDFSGLLDSQGNSIIVTGNGALPGVASLRVAGASLSINNSGSVGIADRISDSASVLVSSASVSLVGSSTISITEQLGTVIFAAGLNGLVSNSATLAINQLTRLNRSTFYTNTNSGTLLLGSGRPSIVGTGSAGSPQAGILPWGASFGASPLTIDPDGRLRPITASEYDSILPAGSSDVNVVLGNGGSVDVPTTLNSLWVQAGSLSGTSTLTLTSRALFVGAGLVTAPIHISPPIAFGSNEGFIHSITTNGPFDFARIDGVVSGTDGVTFTGRIRPTAANTYTGITTVNGGFLTIQQDVIAGAPGPLGADQSAIQLMAGTLFFDASSSSLLIARGINSFGRASIYGTGASSSDFRSITLDSNVSIDQDLLISTRDGYYTMELSGNLSGPGRLRIGSDLVEHDGAPGVLSRRPYTLIISGDNTYAGTTEISNAGTVSVIVGSDTAFGTGTIILSGELSATNGQRVLANPIALLGARIAGAEPLTLSGEINLNGGARTVTVTNSATTTFTGRIYNGTLTKDGASPLALKALPLAGLTVGQGVVRVLPGSEVDLLTTGSIAVSIGASLDLTNHDLVVHFPGPNAAVVARSMLSAGRLASSAADSVHGLGYGLAGDLGLAEFGAIKVDSNGLIIKYTYFGDSNLDGQVDISDLYALASSYNSVNKVWTSGDFNYDGVVNVQDLTLLASNWQAGIGAPLTQADFAISLASLGLPAIMVPEPGAILSLAGCLFFLRRRRNPV